MNLRTKFSVLLGLIQKESPFGWTVRTEWLTNNGIQLLPAPKSNEKCRLLKVGGGGGGLTRFPNSSFP